MNTSELCMLMFSDLKKYNERNFKSIEHANLDITDDTVIDPVVLKSFSSMITRYFIFSDKHPEVTERDMRMLYFKLSIDKVARYFSEYPVADIDDLRPFQMELKRYAKMKRGEEDDNEQYASAV